MYFPQQKQETQEGSISVGNVPLACANHTCFNSQQMSALVAGGPSCEYTWTSVQWWSPVLSPAGGLHSEVPCPSRVRLYSEIQCIMGNGHMGPPLWTDRHYWKITFPQLRWRVVNIREGLFLNGILRFKNAFLDRIKFSLKPNVFVLI